MLGVGEQQGSRKTKTRDSCQGWVLKGPAQAALLEDSSQVGTCRSKLAGTKTLLLDCWSTPCFSFGCSFWVQGSREARPERSLLPLPQGTGLRLQAGKQLSNQSVKSSRAVPLCPQGQPGSPKSALGNRITVPFAAGKCSGRGLASCHAKGFPKVKLDAKERSLIRSGRYQLGNQGSKGRRVQGVGWDYEEVPAAVPGLDAGPSRSPRAVQRWGYNDDYPARAS